MRFHFYVLLIVVAPFLNASFAREAESPQLPLHSDTKIVLNQVGYISGLPKVAMLLNGKKGNNDPVVLRRSDSGMAVSLISPGSERQTGSLWLRELNFSEFNIPGRYYLTHGKVRSPEFKIATWPYLDVSRSLMRAYYLQRCGLVIDDVQSGVRHAACHLDDGSIAHDDPINPRGTPWPATGGWHDAGDYGKYIAPAAATVARLLNLYETASQRYADRQLNIPESGNGTPDLLDEVRYELEWMLRMQRQDGAVYRKLSGAQWPIEAPPDRDLQKRFVYGISSPETGKFAAVMAQAARIYKKTAPEFAEQCLSAAQRAWHWLEQHPEMRVDIHPGDDGGSGGYLASDIDGEAALYTDRDDRLAAAGELFMTTGESRYLDVLKKLIPSADYTLFEWKDISSLVLWSLLRNSDKQLDTFRPLIKTRLLMRADALLQRVNNHPFRLANTRFIWGSNKMAAEEGITLVYAYTLTGKTEYLHAAIDQLDYLFGRNAMDISFVSGAGEKAVQHVNHIHGRNAKINIHGLLVGGPNDSAQDDIAPKGLGMLSYLDNERSYATNEFAIDYNSALIGLIELLGSAVKGE